MVMETEVPLRFQRVQARTRSLSFVKKRLVAGGAAAVGVVKRAVWGKAVREFNEVRSMGRTCP